MNLSDKYISTTENTAKPDAAKKVISDDTYAICELLEILIRQIGRSNK